MISQWKSSLTKVSLILLAFSLLSACGFHLRGVENVPESMRYVTLLPGNASSELQSSLRKVMKTNGIEHRASAPYQIKLLSSRYKRRTATLTRSSDVDEYEISLSVVFMIADSKGKPLTSDITLQRERTYTYDSDAATASSEREEQLRKELHSSLAQSIIRRYLASQPKK